MSIDVLQGKIRQLRCPVMAALAPSRGLLQTAAASPQAAADGYRQICMTALEALDGVVPAVSVGCGSFLALGAEGVRAMQDVLEAARAAGFYVLLDLMQSSLGQSAADMAAACFGPLQPDAETYTPYPCDGVLLDAYLGSDSTGAYTAYCKNGKNVFLMARSANRSARELQDLLSGDRVVHQVTADLAMRWSAGLSSRSGYSEIGVAAGATDADILQRMRRKYDKLFFLVPGFEQPGGAQNAAQAFGAAGYGACVIDAAILSAPLRAPNETPRAAIRQAVESAREAILAYVTVY